MMQGFLAFSFPSKFSSWNLAATPYYRRLVINESQKEKENWKVALIIDTPTRIFSGPTRLEILLKPKFRILKTPKNKAGTPAPENFRNHALPL